MNAFTPPTKPILLATLFLATVAWFAGWTLPSANAQVTNPTPKASEQAAISRKEAARPFDAPLPVADVPSAVDAPVEHGLVAIPLTAQERRVSIAAQIAADERALTKLSTTDREADKQDKYYRSRIEDNEQLLAAITDATLSAPFVHSGRNSIIWTSFTYDVDKTTTKDPTNLLFYGVGSGWDVEYDVRNWTRNDSEHRWENAAGGTCETTHQWLFTSNNYGDPWTERRAPLAGADSYGWWRNVQVVADQCSFDSRHHMRIFEGPGYDPDYSNWSIGAAHFENWIWPCCGHTVASWEDGDWRVQQSFRQTDNGALLWFVETIYYMNFGNAGTHGGIYTDGWGTVIKLIA